MLTQFSHTQMPTASSLLSLILLLLLFPLQPTAPQFAHYKTLISLSRSLLTRVANAREFRGDFAGADRAREIADKLSLVGGSRGILAVGWDFAWNYAFSGGASTAEIYRAGADVVDVVGEVTGLDSGADRAYWVIRNHDRVIEVANSLFRSLLRVFSKSGPLREAILVLQKEVVEGELLKDCMEVGARDLDGMIHLARDFFFPVDSRDSEL